jgi:predicted house-cleaning NTP pyrophosphatase (Maf/HAM1 superfamily)
MEFTVESINNRHDLQFISDSQDVAAVKEYLQCFKSLHQLLNINLDDYDSFFVKVDEGDYSEIYGMVGIVPYLYKTLDKIA